MFPSHTHHVASHISPSFLRNCRDILLVSHVSIHRQHTDARYWLSCSKSVYHSPASYWLSCYYRYDCCMNVRCVLIHMQDCRNGIFLAEGVMQPLQVVITPFVKSTLVLYLHNILVRTRKHDSNCPHLVGEVSYVRYLPYRYGDLSLRYSRKLHQFTVEMCTCRVCVPGYGLTFYVVGCARVSRAFRFVDLNAYISHAYFSFSGLTIWFVGFRLQRSCHMANGGVQRGVTPLTHWGIFSCACTA